MQNTSEGSWPGQGWRVGLVFGVLALAALACSLGTNDDPTPTPNITATPLVVTATPDALTVTPGEVIVLSPTPAPTDVAVPRTLAPPTVVNCVPQTTWPLYTVVPGDTVSLIAQRTGTTTENLAAANCLANPSLIYVGQRLYVPALPPAPTAAPPVTAAATPNPNLPIFRQGLTVQPFWLDASSRAVTYSDTVRVDAGEVLDADVVTFYVNDPAGGAAIAIGTDEDPFDGAFVDYDFPAAGSYTFQAIAANDVSQASSSAFTIRFDPNFVPAGGQPNVLAIAPYAAVNANWIILTPNTTVTLRWDDAPPGATRIDFTLTPTGGEAQTIGSDLNAADGAVITWNVPAGVLGTIHGRATMPDGSVQTSEGLNVAAAS